MEKVKTITHYSDEFKLMVIKEVLSGKISKEAVKRKYGIKGKSAVLNWIRKFEKSTVKQSTHNIKMSKKSNNLNNDLLLNRIKELEDALLEEKIKAEGFSKMIDIAEKEFKIPIRKKYNTKRSKK